MSFFNIKEAAQIYERLREWPAEYKAWPVFNWVENKGVLEVQVYALVDGVAVRSDQDIAANLVPDNQQSWTEKDIDYIMDVVWLMFENNLKDWKGTS
jgi:hypothetical protein